MHITPVFHATWNKENTHLQLPPQTRLRKICEIAWNIISVLIPIILVVRAIGWAVAALSKRATLPSKTYYSPEQIQEIRDIFNTYCSSPNCRESTAFRAAYTVERHTVITPDGAKLATLHFRHRQRTANTPTVLYFQPNLALSEQFIHSPILKEAVDSEAVVDFVTFDYRDVSLSEARPGSKGDLARPEELIIDGEAVYQFVRETLQVPPRLIHMHAWSIGGVISAHVKAMHPECDAPYVNERSLSSTAEVVNEWLKGWKKLLLWWFPYAMRKTGWDLRAPIKQVQGPLMIVYNPLDEVIAYRASCHREAIRQQRNFVSVRLSPGFELDMAKRTGFKIHEHAHPLTGYRVGETFYGQENLPAIEVIGKFLFYPAAPVA